MDYYFIEKRPMRTSVFKINRRTHAVPSLLEDLTTEAAQSNMSACKLARRHACMHDCVEIFKVSAFALWKLDGGTAAFIPAPRGG